MSSLSGSATCASSPAGQGVWIAVGELVTCWSSKPAFKWRRFRDAGGFLAPGTVAFYQGVDPANQRATVYYVVNASGQRCRGCHLAGPLADRCLAVRPRGYIDFGPLQGGQAGSSNARSFAITLAAQAISSSGPNKTFSFVRVYQPGHTAPAKPNVFRPIDSRKNVPSTG